MELLDRYLAAIRFWLPKGQREDILAELTEDIHSQIEERESALSRKLTESELAELLQKRGSPYRVACRYLPQRYLIGPAFFPLYTLILKGIALFYLLPWFLAWVFMVTFLPSYRAAHPGWELTGTLDQLWGLALYAFAFTTLGVVFLERSAEGTGLIDRWDRKWNPRLMRPEPKDPLRIPRSDSIGQFFGGLVFAAYWLGAFRMPTIPEVQLGFTPILCADSVLADPDHRARRKRRGRLESGEASVDPPEARCLAHDLRVRGRAERGDPERRGARFPEYRGRAAGKAGDPLQVGEPVGAHHHPGHRRGGGVRGDRGGAEAPQASERGADRRGAGCGAAGGLIPSGPNPHR